MGAIARHARLLFLLLISCGSTAAIEPEFVLRISTYYGLKRMHPFQRVSMTAHLGSLVYEPLRTYFAGLQRHGRTVVLSPLAMVPSDSLPRLAAAIEHPSRPTIRVVGADVQVQFALDADAKGMSLDLPLLATGPYQVGNFEEDKRIELIRRHGDGPTRIVVLAFATQDEEWRRLMSHDVDLVPSTSPAFAQHFRDMSSVRIVPLGLPSTIALIFNTRGTFSDRALRQQIAMTIDRSSLARAITGDETNAVDTEHRAASVAFSPARDMRLLLPDTVSEFQRVAMILEQQLAPIGIRLTVKLLPPETFTAEAQRGAFDFTLLFGGYDRRHWPYLTCTSPGNLAGYCSAEFDQAVTVEDEEAARRIAARDVPLTPLYVRREVVAMDARLCLTTPESVNDMSWLTTVHPCREDER